MFPFDNMTYLESCLRFAPLVSPSPNTGKGYLSQGPRKGRRWTSPIILDLPSPGPSQPSKRARMKITQPGVLILRQPLQRPRFIAPRRRPLDVCAFSFFPSRPSLTGLELEGNTYPGDHVKVGTGLMFLLPPPGFTSNRRCQLTEVEGKDTP